MPPPDPTPAAEPILHFHTDTGGAAHAHVHVAPARNDDDTAALLASFDSEDTAVNLDPVHDAPLLRVVVTSAVHVPSVLPGHPGQIEVATTDLVLTKVEARRLAGHLRWLSDVL